MPEPKLPPDPAPTAVTKPVVTPRTTPVAVTPRPSAAPSAKPAAPVDPNAFNPDAARSSLRAMEGILASCKKPDGPTGPNHLQVVHTDVEMSIGFAELEWAKARGTIARAYAQHYPGHHLDPAFIKRLQDSFDEGYGPQCNPALAALAAYLRTLAYQ